MIKKSIAEELNQQINRELHSAYIYLGMSAYCVQRGLDGFANWLKVQAKEESSHALKIMGYLQDRSVEVTLFEVPKPQVRFGSLQEVFEKTLEHEKYISECISGIAAMALEEKDLMTYEFLQWFLKEQVEEEASANAVLDKIELVGEQGPVVLALDAQLGKRE